MVFFVYSLRPFGKNQTFLFMQYLPSFLNYLRFEKRYSEHTIVAYEGDLKQFSEFLKEIEVEDEFLITSKTIRNWLVWMHHNDYKPRTIHRKVASIKVYYKHLLRMGLIQTNPASTVLLPKIPKNLPGFIKENEMDFLLDQVPFEDSYEGVRDRTMIDLFYATGIRLSELVELKDVNFDLKSRMVKVLGKRNKERLVPLNQSTLNGVLDYIRIRNESFGEDREPAFFLTASGKKVYHKLVYRVVNKYLRLVSTLAQKSPHIIRHTFATILLNRGADLNVIKELLGHANLNATQIYTHNTFEKLSTIYKQAHPRA